MDTNLLATKLKIPPQPQLVVPRERLSDALERRIPHYKLVLVAAPAGYGKTTLLAQWAGASRLPIAWLSLSPEDNDLERFFRYLLAAWEAVQPGLRESTAGVLLGGMSPNMEAVLTAFINVANDLPGKLVFVLDDYHLIEDATIHQALAFLLDHLPPTVHFVLAGRAEPPLPLARYRARQELLELRAEDLQLSTEETADFMRRVMELDLAQSEVEKLHAQLEGWVAGLRLAGLTLQRRQIGVEQLVISGKHRFIADYLSEDVLAHLPASLRQFLLHTSILDHLCGPLCEAVTGKEGGQEMLETLERKNLFLVPLDDSRQWFRYHRLFAGFLQAELNRRHPEQVAGLHRRAARWCLAHDLPEQAFRHAVAGSDVEIVVQIFDRYVNAKLLGGEFNVLKRWLESLPAEWYSTYPALDLARAGFLFFTGDFEACVRYVDDVEQRLANVESEDARRQMARVTAVRCFVACAQNDLPQAENLAGQALRDLPEEDPGFRPGIYAALGDTYRQNGRWEAARQCYLKVLDFTHAPTVRVQSAHVYGALADLELRKGRLKNAASYWSKALAAIQERDNWGRLPLPVTGWVYTRMADLHYEWNQLAEAWRHLSRGLERAELGGDVRALIAGYILGARLRLAEGEVEGAAEYLEQARPLIEQAPFAEWTSQFERVQLELWLAQDRLRAAVNWTDEILARPAFTERPESEITQLAVARVLIVKGDTPAIEQALALLGRLLRAAEGEGRVGVAIEALALQALARWRRGDWTGAMTSLERALRLAEPEGYLRLFVDLGLPMARLLQEARSRAVMSDYVENLLAAFGGDLSLPTQETLPEPLTTREQEVLELLAAGLTNPEIADKLVISPETVKKHTGNIYAKLGVTNRTEAAARARELDLLG